MSNLSQIKQRKLAVAGYKNVGKTALARQFTEQGYSEGYFPTIENTYKKEFIYRGNTYVADIVDTAGQDTLTPFVQRTSIFDGYILVFSVTNRPSFDLIRRLNTDIVNETGNPNIPRIIVGNKTDAGPRRVEQSEAIQLAKELGCDYVETSAKNNERIQETFMTLLDRIEADYGTAPLEKNQSTCIIA